MYRFNKDGISVLIVVDKRRRKNNGLYPVKIEVVFKRIQKYFPTGQDVAMDEWEKIFTSSGRNQKFSSIINSFRLVCNAVDQLIFTGRFSFTRLELLLGRVDLTLDDLMNAKMKDLFEEGCINSYYRYRTTLNAIYRFTTDKNISFETVDAGWLKKCEHYWRLEGKCDTTINIYMKTLQSIFKVALNEGYIRESDFPFGKDRYRIPASSSRKLAMSKEQIETIKEWKGDVKTEYWRDLWMFSYLCNGINFRDMLFLKYGNIKGDELSFVRSKTGKTNGHTKVIRAIITPYMRELMARSGNGADGPAETFIFRHAKGGENPSEVTALVRRVIAACNAAMKRLAADIEIEPFSTYSARHSFATILKRNGVDISYISESLGHSSIATTECYLAGYDKEDRKKFAELLI